MFQWGLNVELIKRSKYNKFSYNITFVLKYSLKKYIKKPLLDVTGVPVGMYVTGVPVGMYVTGVPVGTVVVGM